MATLPHVCRKGFVIRQGSEAVFLLLLQHVQIYDWRLNRLKELNIFLIGIQRKERTRN